MKKLLDRFELRIAVLAVMTLLFAQWGAMSHAYSHGATVASSPASHQTGVTTHDLCTACLAYAPLLCAAGTPAATPFIEPHGRDRVTRSTAESLANLDLRLAFRSRAPPPMA